MSGPSLSGGEPITDKRQLVDYIAAGAKPRSEWRIGTEHEKFVFRRADLHPVPYDGPDGIRALLEGVMKFGWQPVLDAGNLIGLSNGTASISLEPGGQFELSGAPLDNLHQTCAEVQDHLKQIRPVCDALGLGMLGIGFQPKWRRDDISFMPKGRYQVMRRYMPTKGKLGLDMMLRTCTVQVNLDFGDEADMVKKFRVSMALQPVAVALFANSPFYEGRPSGFLSFRSHVWTDVDPDRCGMLPFVFEPGFGYERYVDYMLDVPMYFVYRDGRYIDVAGQSFRDFMAARLPGLPGVVPTMSDWVDHLTTAFPEVRLKRFLEMRGADAGPWAQICALPALWSGLLYDDAALDAADRIIADWSAADRETLHQEAPRGGLKTPFRGRTLRELALEVLELSRAGLQRRQRINSTGENESYFLATLFEAAHTGKTSAERLLERYATEWRDSVDPIYHEMAY